MKILIVDDDPFAGEMASVILESDGHDCTLVESGLAALELLGDDSDGFEVIISDMNMPLLSGLELFRELRDQGIATPFVLLTGDDPAPLHQQEPRLEACLMKDASLEHRLPSLVEHL
ncbi:response regulator [Thiocapsa imhoffii]|uniref:Response regulator n=1 Tax=Thiocapsa imhoffii TaxID=382777 RepID=A0A9X1BBG0_9GAMM|nr:response regulator [Thiocapsa imhoffii]MBK1646640.1 response regulator [Thiocapsa imhoffii]